jgi:hypothetical protein
MQHQKSSQLLLATTNNKEKSNIQLLAWKLLKRQMLGVESLKCLDRQTTLLAQVSI